MGQATKGRPGIRWDSVVDEGWKGIGHREGVLSIERFEGYKAEVEG